MSVLARYDSEMPLHLGRHPPDDPLDHPAISDSVRALARRGELRRYAKGTLLIQEGDVGDTIYVIASGRLRIYSDKNAKGREITFGVYGPGEYVGEMGLDGGPRAASVIAVEPTVCAVVTRHTLERHIADHPGFAIELLAKVIARARSATWLAGWLHLSVYERLKLLLDSMATLQADGTRVIEERLTHKDIAGRIGCTREMVSRVMKDLEDGGYIEVGDTGLTIRRALPFGY